MKNLFIISSLLLLGLNGFGQNLGNEIHWCQEYKLTWNDFKAPTKDWNVGAVTYCGISLTPIKTNRFNGKSKYKAIATFNIDSSFHFPSKVDNDVLRHEQFHFNIAELYARKMRQELSFKSMVSNNIATEIFNRLFKQYLDFQENYEKETELGLNTEVQLQWENNVQKLLEELQTFKLECDNKN